MSKRENTSQLFIHLITKFMFDFEKLEVYKKTKQFNQIVYHFVQQQKVDKVTYDQLRRASFSIMLNIAEGSGRFTKPDKRNFYIIARGSVFECVAIFGGSRPSLIMPS